MKIDEKNKLHLKIIYESSVPLPCHAHCLRFRCGHKSEFALKSAKKKNQKKRLKEAAQAGAIDWRLTPSFLMCEKVYVCVCVSAGVCVCVPLCRCCCGELKKFRRVSFAFAKRAKKTLWALSSGSLFTAFLMARIAAKNFAGGQKKPTQQQQIQPQP